MIKFYIATKLDLRYEQQNMLSTIRYGKNKWVESFDFSIETPLISKQS